MYADRKKGLNPAALGGAALINGGLIAIIATLGAVTVNEKTINVLKGYEVKTTPPPEPLPTPEPVRQRSEPKQTPRPIEIVTPPSPYKADADQPKLTSTGTITDWTPDVQPGGTGTTFGTGGTAVEPPAPVMIDAVIDPSHARRFQPDYPAAELAREVTGTVSVRVLIGTDGRVKAVESISAPSPGLFRATRDHALRNWRFRPATRDGIPVESWKRMNVQFVLNG